MTQIQYTELRNRMEELKDFAYIQPRNDEDRSKRDEYWAASYMVGAHDLADAVTEAVRDGDAIVHRLIPWGGDVETNIKVWCERLVENGVDTLVIDSNQSTAFGNQIACFMRNGWYLVGCRDEDLVLLKK